MWTEKTFKDYYTKYDVPSRKDYLYTRTEYLSNKYDFGNSILLFGGALGWGGEPLLMNNKFVYNYDNSKYIQNLATKHDVPLTPWPYLPSEKATFDTIFFEDSIFHLDAFSKHKYITECIKYNPTLILVIESSEEIKISERANANLFKFLSKRNKTINFVLKYYNTHEFIREMGKNINTN